MDEQEWSKLCANTTERMIEHIQSFITPISISKEDYGVHHGTGSYYENEGEIFIISNEHVLKLMNNNILTHKYFENDNICKLLNTPKLFKEPIDIGISKIDENIWNIVPHKSTTIPINRFATKHAPAIHELLFFAGYSGEKSNFYFNTLSTCGTPYSTQEIIVPADVEEADPNYHFALFYLPDRAKSVNGKSFLPDPHGFSGSLVWDTKLVKCLNEGIEWHSEYAEVTGIVWGWPSSSGCILATKIEHFRNYL